MGCAFYGRKMRGGKRAGRGSGIESAVDVASMSDVQNVDHPLRVIKIVEDPVITDANSTRLGATKLDAYARARGIPEALDRLDESLCHLGWQSVQCLLR